MSEVKQDYNGRILGWIPIKKKPKMYMVGLPPKICSHCGKVYMDTWSLFCSLDGKWLVGVERLDLEHRKLLGFNEPSHIPAWLLVNASVDTTVKP